MTTVIITTILLLAVLGFITYLVLALIPMAEPFPTIVKAVAGLLALFLVLDRLGLWRGGVLH